jgi:inner membrane protein
MASSWTHAVGAIAVASLLVPRDPPPRTWFAIAVCAAVPDLDAVGRLFGAGDVAWLGGHRALTHSIPFAITLAAVLCLTILRSISGIASQLLLWLALSLAIASHGVLDSFTTYGEGIQFWAPFSDIRYRSPFPVLGDGIVRDTIAFVAFLAIARAVIKRRGLITIGSISLRPRR